jgi:hypothetical protein
MNDREMIGRKLAHAFPWNATAQVHVAMALRRREAYVSSGAATIKLQCGWQVSRGQQLSCLQMHGLFTTESAFASRCGVLQAAAKGKQLQSETELCGAAAAESSVVWCAAHLQALQLSSCSAAGR